VDLTYPFILAGGFLVVLAVLVGQLSNRIGAPLLLVFLAIGMLAGEDGPLGIHFSDFSVTYQLGSLALAIILFDGGLRTPVANFRIAFGPSLALATAGVLITAAIAGVAASWLFGLSWIQGLLLGAIISSTDAAAVFVLLHQRGTELQRRVGATLETESGINDPMAVFLTVACIGVLRAGQAVPGWEVLGDFAREMIGGAVVGVAGGYALLWLINRAELAPGLYPILAAAGAIVIFAGAAQVHASGFLAVYLAGLVIGNNRHRARTMIDRVHDALAWLSQILLFLMLGLLVTPHDLLPDLGKALGVAAVLVLVARPVATVLCLTPFRMSWREQAFIAWVGLRGAVPIFLAIIPLLAGLPGASSFFNVAFVVVLVSLTLQGWTVVTAARLLHLELPPTPEPADRMDFMPPSSMNRDIVVHRVAPGSRAIGRPLPDLHLPPRTRVMGVIRDGVVMDRAKLERLTVDDTVLLVVPPEQHHALDRLFATPPAEARVTAAERELGEFGFPGATPASDVALMYGLPTAEDVRGRTLATHLAELIGRSPVPGDRAAWGPVELVVRAVDDDGAITQIGLEVEPNSLPSHRRRLRSVLGLLNGRKGGGDSGSVGSWRDCRGGACRRCRADHRHLRRGSGGGVRSRAADCAPDQGA
jgi:cell volume regulation protein A